MASIRWGVIGPVAGEWELPRSQLPELVTSRSWWPSSLRTPLQDDASVGTENWLLVAPAAKPCSLTDTLFRFRHELWSASPWTGKFRLDEGAKKPKQAFAPGKEGMLPEEQAGVHALFLLNTRLRRFGYRPELLRARTGLPLQVKAQSGEDRNRVICHAAR